MRCRSLIVVTALLVAAGVAAAAGTRTVTYRVEEMNTAAQAQRLEGAIRAVKGVVDTASDPGARLLIVRYDSARCSVVDIGEAGMEAGFSMNPVTGKGQGQGKHSGVPNALLDFQQVMQQVQEFAEKDRYGVVRNLMPGMRLRRDALLAAERAASGSTKKIAGQESPYALAQQLSRSVDDLAAAAEVRDKGRVNGLIPKVKQNFRALAKAENFDDTVAVAEPATAKPKSLQEQLKEEIEKLTK